MYISNSGVYRAVKAAKDNVEKLTEIEKEQQTKCQLANTAVTIAKLTNKPNEQIEELQRQADNERSKVRLAEIYTDMADSKRTKTEINNKNRAPFKTLSQVIAEGFGLDDKPDYINVKAVCTSIKKDTAVAIAEISDATGAQWITLLGNIAETLLGMTADDFGKYKLNQKESIIEDVIRKAMNRERIFKLRAKAEQYNNERKIRFTCVGVSDVDWSSHGRRLIGEINRMKPVQH